ncbi:hypothetical protein B0A52_08154 [Exophiala mesophila]|uniref:Dolichyl-diphosphooligosaccharide--protein glycosyltransferase subunit OST2 n=1 Tax=Exophiala mesophila TaxID=212818 RepID=A0A438MV87_EXOME|nr:hypothetical protein B0A52_08154 [Exophiala mesophila]
MAKKVTPGPKPALATPTKVPATAGSTLTPSVTPAKVQTQTALSPRSSPQEIIVHVWNKYVQDTPSRTILLDVFMAWLVVVGAVQFLYCILAGNYPFNAFLSGFSAAVGQFVLTASLRMQTSERPPADASLVAKKTTAKTIDGVTGEIIEDTRVSTERAFADFVFGSLILHGFCVNFIN